MVVSALALLSSCTPPGTQPRETPETQPRTQPRETSTTPDGGITRDSAGAECNSHSEPGLSRLNWASVTYQLYTICYDERYKEDVAIVVKWIDATLELGWQKYGVARPTRRGKDLYTTVLLPSVATQNTSQGVFHTRCCYGDDPVRAEIHYLTPSAWGGLSWGRLRIPIEDYHPHYVMHEMSHVVQFGFPEDSRPPTWIIEGLAEYDAFFYSTEYNRTLAIDSLIRHVHRYEQKQIFCCHTLGRSVITTTSVYAGGALIMLFLAERFGEGIHVELLTTPLEDLLEQRGTTVEETFDELQAWFDQRARALNLR